MRSKRGNHAIEVALTLPIFLMVLAGLFDSGWYFYSAGMVEMAVNRGCLRAALVDPALAEPGPTSQLGMNQWLQYLGRTCEDAECTVALTGERPSQFYTCNVRVDYEPLWGLMAAGPLERTATVLVEIQRTP